MNNPNIYYKKYDNGLRLIINRMEGYYSVASGLMVKTGSINETEIDNGISHFIEHSLFKGTEKRSAYDISAYSDKIGGQINAYTSKESTCYYTRSTPAQFRDTMEVLSDLFFNSVFDEEELELEKDVIIEEINMGADESEEHLLELLAESCYGKKGMGQSILGSVENVKKFTRADIEKYMTRYYCSDNVVISIAGNIDIAYAQKVVEEFFVYNFKRQFSAPQLKCVYGKPNFLAKYKNTEQTHIGFAVPSYGFKDSRNTAICAANLIFGGGMSSRLFQKAREEMGLCYNVYSYVSQYKFGGVMEIYAGVNSQKRDVAVEVIVDEFKRVYREGVTEEELETTKELMRSTFIMGQEGTSAQMLTFARTMQCRDVVFDFEERMANIDKLTVESVNSSIKDIFILEKMCTATLGPNKTPIII